MLHVGTAAWALPRQVRDRFPDGASNLERYAARLNATEINTSFYRPHRRATYARWAATVPDDFRFAVKLPRAITHEAALVDCEASLARFAEEIAGLGNKQGPMLIQLPGKFAFDPATAASFFKAFATIIAGQAVCEPRHPSWFEPEADRLLRDHRIARVAADPARVPAAAEPGGWPGFAYFRLHGSPRIYRSKYESDALATWARRAAACLARGIETWAIFDNTASGAATGDALTFKASIPG
jgi:uncharacterized protein YecE (DUF72 family)